MAIDGTDVERPDRAAALAIDINPWHPGHKGGADGRRPPDLSAGRERPVPPLEDTSRFSLRLQVGGAGSESRLCHSLAFERPSGQYRRTAAKGRGPKPAPTPRPTAAPAQAPASRPPHQQ